MGHPAEPLHRRATYADLEAVPAHQVAELIGGTLRVMPRPEPRHASTSSALGVFVGGPFGHGLGGPGGWWILDEPEIHFPDPEAAGEVEVPVPDLAGWTRERMPELPEEAHFTIAPDWICEVLSSSTEETDRTEKMPIYAREGVRFAWLIDPIGRTLEAYALRGGRRWSKAVVHRDAERVRVPPFEAVELDLSALWAR
jgi:Uma2 family endonuclease